MESNSVETKPRKTKFATAIENAWKKARETYLSESGLRENSEEWKYIMETNDFSQVEEVINETWAKYNNPSGGVSPEPAQPVKSTVKKRGLKARLTKLISRKESGKIYVQPEPKGVVSQGFNIESRLQLEQKLLGRSSKGGNIIDAGLQIADKVHAVTRSEKLKTVVNVTLKFSNSLQRLTGISEVVNFC